SVSTSPPVPLPTWAGAVPTPWVRSPASPLRPCWLRGRPSAESGDRPRGLAWRAGVPKSLVPPTRPAAARSLPTFARPPPPRPAAVCSPRPAPPLPAPPLPDPRPAAAVPALPLPAARVVLFLAMTRSFHPVSAAPVAAIPVPPIRPHFNLPPTGHGRPRGKCR